ncbi:unnamed protein product [Anisakis simplex]|uniref:HTH CENPB-type domain-containing protein n=1 Tax=Anisakis simplex TaxID=6269 RepID=A0A0M3JZN8_ANISI|nr:unnamed protein product [Anisakis simplex]
MRQAGANGNAPHNGERPSQRGRKLKQYVLEEKLDIIDYAKVIGNRAAGREFNVAESSIREWRKNEQRLRSMFETTPERSRLDGGGRRPLSEDLEKSLLLYIASKTATDSTPLTWYKIKEKANDIWNEICERDGDLKAKEFSANMGWVARFIKRNNILLPAPSSQNSTTTTSVERNDLLSRSTETSLNRTITMPNAPNGLLNQADATTTVISAAQQQNTQIVSPKRRRKNFTPKKLVDHTVIDAAIVPLGTGVIESKDFSSLIDVSVIPQTAVTVVTMCEEDENIDVCF